MFLRPLLATLIVASLLLVTGISFAQSPSISVSFSQNPIQEGTRTTVTMTFSGLPLNTQMRFHGCVRENFPDCEGAGLGDVFDIFTGNSGTFTHTGTIIGSCPIGSYHLDVDLRTATDAILTEKSVIFSVVDPYAALGGAFHRLGAIGVVFRNHLPELNVEIWGIDPDSKGYFILRVTQSQIDAAPPNSLVASSADGRAAVRVGGAPERVITLSLGPNPEGKVHHATLAEGLGGMIIGTMDTQGGAPGVVSSSSQLVALPSASQPPPSSATTVLPQPARADGSIVHVVRPGDTIITIAQAYGVNPQTVVERNQLTHGGRWIYPGQQLIIRDATAEVIAVTVSEEDELPQPVFKGDEP